MPPKRKKKHEKVREIFRNIFSEHRIRKS